MFSAVPEPGSLSFSDDFRYRVHELMSLGFADACDQIQPTDEEPDITSRIVDAINRRLECLEDERPIWYDLFSASDNPRSLHQRKTGKSRPQIDICIRCGQRPCPTFHIETKRLRVPGFPARLYTRSGGMYESFIEGAYAAEFPEAGMLGYVQSGSLADWKERIQSQIGVDQELLELEGSQEDCCVHEAFPDEWRTRHRRPSLGRPIMIYHMLLDCT